MDKKFQLTYKFQTWTPSQIGKRHKKIWEVKTHDYEMRDLPYAALYALEFLRLLDSAVYVKLEEKA